MRTILFTSMLLFIGTMESESMTKQQIPYCATLDTIVIKPDVGLINGKLDNRLELIQALGFIESGGNSKVIGDLHLGEPSVGLLQIRPIMVKEVNRILKKKGLTKKFKNSDRKHASKSIEMFNIWADAYHLDSSFEKMARNWNGGPTGYKKNATLHYWSKILTYTNKNL